MISAKRGKARMLWDNVTVTANLRLMRVSQILLSKEPSMLVMKNEHTLDKQRMKLKFGAEEPAHAKANTR